MSSTMPAPTVPYPAMTNGSDTCDMMLSELSSVWIDWIRSLTFTLPSWNMSTKDTLRHHKHRQHTQFSLHHPVPLDTFYINATKLILYYVLIFLIRCWHEENLQFHALYMHCNYIMTIFFTIYQKHAINRSYLNKWKYFISCTEKSSHSLPVMCIKIPQCPLLYYICMLFLKSHSHSLLEYHTHRYTYTVIETS